MFRGITRIPLAVGCFLAVLAACPARADDHKAAAKAELCPSFRRQADLAKWLKENMIPGRTRQQDVLVAFGPDYRHAWAGFDHNFNSRFDYSIFIFNLDKLGVHQHLRWDALIFHFDKESGRLLSAGIEEEEHQTGFHLQVQSEQ